jgi:Zn-dependent protease
MPQSYSPPTGAAATPAPPDRSDVAPPRSHVHRVGINILKTLGSMALSVAVYMLVLPWQVALGFVLLIFVHEMGHVLAMRFYRLRASAPIFIPFVGALIDLKDDPPNAKVEAIVGIGGPAAGALACLVCCALFVMLDNPIFLVCAYWGFIMNLFNMLPVPPLDGGRITAAISPYIWMGGFALLLAYVLWGIASKNISPLLLILAVYAVPRIWRTIRGRERDPAYYGISWRATCTMAVSYLLLGAILAYGFVETRLTIARLQQQAYQLRAAGHLQ